MSELYSSNESLLDGQKTAKTRGKYCSSCETLALKLRSSRVGLLLKLQVTRITSCSKSHFPQYCRKLVCHVISITYPNILDETLCEQLGLVNENAVNQWIAKNGWKQSTEAPGHVLISTQDEQIKTKEITEKIDMDSVAGIMASCY